MSSLGVGGREGGCWRESIGRSKDERGYSNFELHDVFWFLRVIWMRR